MLSVDRQELLLKYVNDSKTATVAELSDFLKASKATVRRDIDELSSKGLLQKTYGGAVSFFSMLAVEVPSNEKSTLNVEEKKRIGAAAAALVKENDIIALDSGTTTLEIARHLNDKKVTVITNDLKIAMELAPKNTVTLYLAGGLVEPNVYSASGKATEDFFSRLRADKSFLGADAISVQSGVTNRTLQEVPVKRAIAMAGKVKVLVLDHTKFEREVFAKIGLLDQLDAIITDAIDPYSREKFEEMGIKIILA